MNPKVVSLKKMVEIRRKYADEGKKVVFTNGCFDILHAGHVKYLQKARDLGDVLILGLNKDASISRLKGPTRPIVPEQDRAEVIAALGCIDHVVLFGEDTPYRLIKGIKPDVLAKGGDWAIDEIVGKDILDEYGGEVKRVRLVEGRSTTNIVEKISELAGKQK